MPNKKRKRLALPTLNSLMGRVLWVIQKIYLRKDRVRKIRNFPISSARFALNPIWKGELYFLIYGCPRAYREEFEFIKSNGPYTGDILDIGANIGIYSIFFSYALTQERYKVYAFEPIQALCGRIWENTKLNKENIIPESFAVGNIIGTISLFTDRNLYKDPGQSSTISLNKVLENTIKITVPIITIDSYCEKHNIRPAFIKIDTEGNELDVLRGGLKTIEKYSPKIFFEVWKENFNGNFKEAERKFTEVLAPLGYRLYFHDVPRRKKTPVQEAIDRKEITTGNWWAEKGT